MSQLWYANTPYPGNNYATDLNNMRAMFETLRSGSSGSSAPANAVEGMLWRDTNKKLLKLRGVSAWFGLMHGSVNQKMYVYRNDTDEGWVVDSSVSDCVLAFRGGGAYTTGGAAQGSWWISGLSGQHYHGVPDHAHACGGPSTLDPETAGYGHTVAKADHTHAIYGGACNTGWATSDVTHNGSWRPRAAVGTLQRMDI